MVLTVAMSTVNGTNHSSSSSSVAGQPVTLETKKQELHGRANQKWAFESETGIVDAFATETRDIGNSSIIIIFCSYFAQYHDRIISKRFTYIPRSLITCHPYTHKCAPFELIIPGALKCAASTSPGELPTGAVTFQRNAVFTSYLAGTHLYTWVERGKSCPRTRP